MSAKMTKEKVLEMGGSWNKGDPDYVVSFFAEDGEYYSSVGDERLGKGFKGKKAIREGAERFFQLFPHGKFENVTAAVYGDFGTLEWDFANYDQDGKELSRTAGCDLLHFEGDLIKVKNAFRKVKA